MALDGLPCCSISPSEAMDSALVKGGLASSKRQAREFIKHGAVRINGVLAAQAYVEDTGALFDTFWVVQKGKKHFCLFRRAA
ncbi:S4 domain-containing protein [Halomonas sp. 18071143]|uniref:S4 domain-containing protein n=1 Tax=Halomonas sp. 18071143 TaxID=2855441 RepID=UPI003528FA99